MHTGSGWCTEKSARVSVCTVCTCIHGNINWSVHFLNGAEFVPLKVMQEDLERPWWARNGRSHS